MSKPTTHVAVVLDKSGSMDKVRDETISGFNDWLAEMQAAPVEEYGEAHVTITLFDTRFVTPVVDEPVGKIQPLDSVRYRPSGYTALYDAVADAVRKLDEAHAGNTTDKFLVCVITDGEDNSSRETTHDQLKALVAEHEARGNWTFTYLSAGINAVADATTIGINLGNTASYVGNAAGTRSAFLAAARGTTSVRGGLSGQSMSFYSDTGQAGHVGVGPDITRDDRVKQATTSGWVKP